MMLFVIRAKSIGLNRLRIVWLFSIIKALYFRAFSFLPVLVLHSFISTGEKHWRFFVFRSNLKEVANMSDFDARKGLLTFAVISTLVLFQACATTQSSVGDERFSRLEGKVAQMESRFPAIENRLASTEKKSELVDAKADQALSKADLALSEQGNLRVEKRLVLNLKEGVVYGFDSAMLTAEDKKNIDVFLSDLKGENNGHQTFVVGGHADSTGTDRYNYNLGRKRADSVAQYLILDKKIDPMQVVIVSFGESSPLTDNKTSEGREKNRRVEIRVFSDVITTSSGMTTAQR